MGATLRSLLTSTGNRDEWARAAADVLAMANEEDTARSFELERERVIGIYSLRKTATERVDPELSGRIAEMVRTLESRTDERVRLHSLTHLETDREILVVTDLGCSTILGVIPAPRTKPE